MELPDRLYEYKTVHLVSGQHTHEISVVSFNNQKYILKQFRDNASFKREQRIQDQVKHLDFVVDFYTVFKDAWKRNLVMEYIEGHTLGQKMFDLSKNKHEALKKGLSYIKESAKCIKILNEEGIIHRDIKVQNLIVDKNDEIRMIDFDISCRKGYHRSPLFRSQHYHAPEQNLFNQIARSTQDIFSLGFSLLVSVYYSQGNPYIPMKNVLPNLDYDSSNLELLINQMMHPKRKKRINSWDEVIERLDLCINQVNEAYM